MATNSQAPSPRETGYRGSKTDYKTYSYFKNRPDVVKIFEDLEGFHDFCRIEMRKFDPAELYRKDSKSFGAFWASTHQHTRKPYQGTKPWNNNKTKFFKK